jgi:hypothetical protein
MSSEMSDNLHGWDDSVSEEEMDNYQLRQRVQELQDTIAHAKDVLSYLVEEDTLLEAFGEKEDNELY